MKCSMSGQEKCDIFNTGNCLIEMTAWAYRFDCNFIQEMKRDHFFISNKVNKYKQCTIMKKHQSFDKLWKMFVCINDPPRARVAQ